LRVIAYALAFNSVLDKGTVVKRRLFVQGPVTLLGGVSAGLHAPVALAQLRDINAAVDKADRERMLIQRMGKAFLAIGQGVQTAQARQILQSSMAAFDRSLVELRAFAPSPALQGLLKKLALDWDDYKLLLVGKEPAKAEAPKVIDSAVAVLGSANAVEKELVKLSGKRSAELVSIAGEQRMRSQAMAKYYFAATWGIDPSGAAREIAATRLQYVAAHARLAQDPETTPTIRTDLEQVAAQFTFLEAGLQRLKPQEISSEAMRNLFTSSERVLEVMDRVTGRYAAQTR
jgi:septum formation topological specificity factor MinE